MDWKLKTFEELSNNELYSILQLRSEVFVVEQNCPYQDMDNEDQCALHLMVISENLLVGYVRIFEPGQQDEYAVIGRVIVKLNQRKTGLGKLLMIRAIAEIEALYKTNQIKISAQMYLLRFYAELGFKTEGEMYLEDNIPHIKMKLNSINKVDE